MSANPKKLQILGNFPSGEIDSSEVRTIVDEYLTENPPVANITINGEKPDENGNFVINTQSEVSNNVVEF